eukprot:scaffold78907_cov17-Tisochrysis_lutea.AAC.1
MPAKMGQGLLAAVCTIDAACEHVCNQDMLWCLSHFNSPEAQILCSDCNLAILACLLYFIVHTLATCQAVRCLCYPRTQARLLRSLRNAL